MGLYKGLSETAMIHFAGRAAEVAMNTVGSLQVGSGSEPARASDDKAGSFDLGREIQKAGEQAASTVSGAAGSVMDFASAAAPIASVAALVFPPLAPVAATLGVLGAARQFAKGDVLGGLSNLASVVPGQGLVVNAIRVAGRAAGSVQELGAAGDAARRGDVLGAVANVAAVVGTVAGAGGHGQVAAVATRVTQAAFGLRTAGIAVDSARYSARRGDTLSAVASLAEAAGSVAGGVGQGPAAKVLQGVGGGVFDVAGCAGGFVAGAAGAGVERCGGGGFAGCGWVRE